MAIKAVRTVVQKLRKGGIKIKKDAVVTVQKYRGCNKILGGKNTSGAGCKEITA